MKKLLAGLVLALCICAHAQINNPGGGGSINNGGPGNGTGSVTPNQFAVGNDTGAVVGLPEMGTSTTGGVTSVAWREDMSIGLFDARRPRVEKIDGNNTVVTLASNPALALQETANEMNCWIVINHKAPTLFIPPGIYQVGVTQAPSLIFGPGMNVYGTAGGTIGLGGSNNEGGTIFTSPYTDSPIFVVSSPRTSTCADGTSQTNSSDGGDIENIQVQGTVNTGGVQSPGSTYTGNAGPHQTGIFIGVAHGIAKNLRAAYTGGTGIDANGQDSDFYDLWAYDTQFWLRADRGHGITYNPSTDGFHGGVELNGTDDRLHGAETYGPFIAPPTVHLCPIGRPMLGFLAIWRSLSAEDSSSSHSPFVDFLVVTQFEIASGCTAPAWSLRIDPWI